jgi:gliding motility-associated-like protein
MKRVLFFLGMVLATFASQAQITSATASDIGPTAYTNGATNDSIYFFCSGLGQLTATPPSGTPGWNFTWQIYNPTDNTWDPFSTVTGQPTSTITNLAGGMYRVTITDGTSTVVGCYRAWVSIVTTPTVVNVSPIPPGCSPFNLQGSITGGSATQIYNPPADPFLVSASTQITVCFTANHTYVSDLGFYLVGPTTCGSPVITLAPNPGAVGLGATCNSGNDLNNLCFSSTSTNTLNVCAPAATPLVGTFGRYQTSGGPQTINWAPIYGCDASQGGWRVQIYDCIGADVGALTNATITFTGTTTCGTPSTITYNSGAINSTINDNTCSAATASIFTVAGTVGTPIPYSGGFIWTSDNPSVFIPNATTSLTPLINPAPTVNTNFTLTLTGGAIPTCGGNNQDTELFVYTPPTLPVIDPVATLCTTGSPVNLTVNIAGGTWSGPGITNPTTGTFNPAILSPGTYTVNYQAPGACGGTASQTVTVAAASNATISPAGPFCTTDGPQFLIAANNGGTWTGTGITDGVSGIFDPSVSGPGTFTITYSIPGACGSTDTEQITVNSANPTITPVSPVCVGSAPFNLSANAAGGTWTGAGITNGASGTFDPSTVSAGTYTITYTIVAPCPATTTTTVTVNGLPTANAGSDASFCVGASTPLSASGGTSYAWSPATGLSATNIANPTANPATTTTYTVVATDANGCQDSDDVTVTVNALPNVSAGSNQTICVGNSTTLSASGAVSYVWSPATGLSATNIPNPTANPNTTTTYTVTGTDANGCVNTSTVTVSTQSVSASATANPATGVEPLVVTFTNTSTGATNYAWDYGNDSLEVTTSTSTSTTYQNSGTYEATLVVTNALGCIDSITLTIVVYDDFALLIPNVFSPNGDGSNDNFEVIGTGIENFSLTIFNRWGLEMGKLNSINDKWDGTKDGKECPAGTYFYVMQLTKANGETIEQNGTITLIRK